MEKILYTKYSGERARAFAIRTDICERDGERFVRKSASGGDGRHMERVASLGEGLTRQFSGTPFLVNRCRKTKEGLEFEYLTGRTLEEHLDGILLAGDLQGTARLLLQYTEKLRAALEREPFSVTPEFSAVFGDAAPAGAHLSAPLTDIDMTANNAIETADGYTLIDYEWTFDFPIPADYVVYRALKYYIYGDSARFALAEFGLFEKAGVRPEDRACFEKMEAAFQDYVRGDTPVLEKLYADISPGYTDMREQTARNMPQLGQFQVFYDYGDGFSAEDSDYLTGSGDGVITLKIAAKSAVRSIRVDPPVDYCLVKLDGVSWTGADGGRESVRCSSNGTRLFPGVILYAAEDAQLIFRGWKKGRGVLEVSLEIEPQEEDGILARGAGKRRWRKNCVFM